MVVRPAARLSGQDRRLHVLSDRALNRATLARQHLLARTVALDPVGMVEHLVGMQAQNPLDPYLALWSRIDGFDPTPVADAVTDGRLVRIVVMRGTIHLVTAADAATLRPLVQPVLDAEIRRHSEHAPKLVGVDLAPALAFAADLLSTTALTTTALRAALAERFPDLDAAAVAYACRCHLPLVQVPPRGVWGRTKAVTLALLPQPLDPAPSIDDAVLRYLAAVGPSTVADVATWSRLTGIREVVERLRPRLVTFADERGRELFDLPDAPRPDPDVEAPVRFLPEYDNVLLSHQDRSRFIGPDLSGFHSFKGTVLVDGRLAGLWRRDGNRCVVETVPLPKRAAAEVEAEAEAVAAFLRTG